MSSVQASTVNAFPQQPSCPTGAIGAPSNLRPVAASVAASCSLYPSQGNYIVPLTLNNVSSIVVTLPPASQAPGCNYEFHVITAGTGTYQVKSPSANIYGQAYNLTTATGAPSFLFAAGSTNLNGGAAPAIGDSSRLWSDGTRWLCEARPGSAGTTSFAAFS